STCTKSRLTIRVAASLRPSRPCQVPKRDVRCSVLGRWAAPTAAFKKAHGVTCGGSRTPTVRRCSPERRLIRSAGGPPRNLNLVPPPPLGGKKTGAPFRPGHNGF